MIRRSISFTQKFGTYYDSMIVCVGLQNYQELINDCEKQRCHEWVRALRARKEELDDLSDSHHFTHWEFKEKNYNVLWLKSWKRDVYHYKTLGHELIHCISFVMKYRMDLIKENEAFAYLFGFLFQEIVQYLGKKQYGLIRKKK